jgi:CubicO group peptidase (beta-lactamase class C family)
MRVLLAGLLGAALGALPLWAQDGIDRGRLEKIPARMQEFVAAGKVAGVVTLVGRASGVVDLKATGYFDMETKAPLRTDHIFQIHSMTKPMVALGILMLAEEGRLSIADPVEKHLPEFRSLADRITLQQLMTHTAGMPLNPPPGIGELHGALHKPLADVALVYSQTPVAFRPGSKWQYSNAGIAVLARVLEVHSGMPFEQFLAKRIFEPLGMKDSYIFPPKEKWGWMPTAYILRDGVPVKYTSDPLGEGAMKYRAGAKYSLPEGGVYSTASDLFLLYQTLLRDGKAANGFRLLSPASVRLMRMVHTGELATNGPGMGWGLGAYVVRPGFSPMGMSPGTYGHGGRYGTFYFIDPVKDLIGVFLIHREGGSDERTAFVQMAYSALVE